MSGTPRRVTVRALAKINLSLEVLHKQADGYHYLRTIFQTVSLADTVDLAFVPGRRTSVTCHSTTDIPANLAQRAAETVMESSGVKGEVRIRLHNRIPMGGGLGGGSSDAAAILLALPVLTGRDLLPVKLHDLAVSLGSDVPFFLLGGTALGLGRGTELYPLSDGKPMNVAIVAPHVHVGTPEAFRALNRPVDSLTSPTSSPKINTSQLLAWFLAGGLSGEEWPGDCRNDFEEVVFTQHPQLRLVKRKLARGGARPAMMTGSGSAVFGIFSSRERMLRAQDAFTKDRFYPVRLVGRRQYQRLWYRQLREHCIPNTWPPRSRYAQ